MKQSPPDDGHVWIPLSENTLPHESLRAVAVWDPRWSGRVWVHSVGFVRNHVEEGMFWAVLTNKHAYRSNA